MKPRLTLLIVSLLCLISCGIVLSQIFVGVEEGDWIEYTAAFTGTPDYGHDVLWARMEVFDVQGNTISLNITTEFSNGTLLWEKLTLNLETGQLGDAFIIPANLNIGDTFFDQRLGNVIITETEKKTYAGTSRTVISATTSLTSYYWDQQTGVLVEGISSFPNFTIHTLIDQTNMWQPQILGFDPWALYTLLAAALISMGTIFTIIILRTKKKPQSSSTNPEPEAE